MSAYQRSSGTLQNLQSQVQYLFGGTPSGARPQDNNDGIELSSMRPTKRRSLLQMSGERDKDKKESSLDAVQDTNGFDDAGYGESETDYVLHLLEPHHTLRGIALQYRVPGSLPVY